MVGFGPLELIILVGLFALLVLLPIIGGVILLVIFTRKRRQPEENFPLGERRSPEEGLR